MSKKVIVHNSRPVITIAICHKVLKRLCNYIPYTVRALIIV